VPLKLDYVTRETVTNLRRNVLMTGAAILTVAVSLALVGGALLVKQAVDNATVQWKGGVELSVFMKPDVQQNEADGLDSELRAMPEVKRIRFVSQADAYDEFKKMFAGSPDMVDSLTPDKMPPSFRVVPKQAEQVEVIGERFRNRPGVLDIEYAKDTVKALLSITRILQVVMWTIALVLLLAAALLILNTIRMAIYARRREVAVMKLVGATNWFIRIPFMFEGLVQGLAGAAAAVAVIWAGSNVLRHSITRAKHLDLLHQFVVTNNEVLGTAIFLVVVGVVVGALGSAVAVSRFLDV
jgi:cell division transport system permease protein